MSIQERTSLTRCPAAPGTERDRAGRYASAKCSRRELRYHIHPTVLKPPIQGLTSDIRQER
jgi:hypothetical protein